MKMTASNSMGPSLEEAEKELVACITRFYIDTGKILLYIKETKLFQSRDKEQTFVGYMDENYERFQIRGRYANELVAAYLLADSLENVIKPRSQHQVDFSLLHQLPWEEFLPGEFLFHALVPTAQHLQADIS